jgi:hypothetical protein
VDLEIILAPLLAAGQKHPASLKLINTLALETDSALEGYFTVIATAAM